eukprot:gb/GECH01011570.1/.p1 GENE.gb/GECH01011570.1/~~gb/GECH01011570.1/.p1  ORF type:complete len:205 (+),score=37.88 gb/GECH01011570.1/:1-615(+)
MIRPFISNSFSLRDISLKEKYNSTFRLKKPIIVNRPKLKVTRIAISNTRLFHTTPHVAEFSKEEKREQKEQKPKKKSPYEHLPWVNEIKKEEKYAPPGSHTEYFDWIGAYAKWLRIVVITILFILLFLQIYAIIYPGSIVIERVEDNDLTRLETIEMEALAELQKQKNDIMEKHVSGMIVDEMFPEETNVEDDLQKQESEQNSQ